MVANNCWTACPVKVVSRRRRGPKAHLYGACRSAKLRHGGRRGAGGGRGPNTKSIGNFKPLVLVGIPTAADSNQPANPKKAPRKPTGLRHAPVWRAEFLSGRIVAMVGSGLRESCAELSMDASMLGPILARRQLWRASFFGVVGAIARTTNDSRPNEIDRLHGHGASRGAWSSWRRRELAAGAQGQHGRKQRGPDVKPIK
jgi:hypothetical protein